MIVKVVSKGYDLLYRDGIFEDGVHPDLVRSAPETASSGDDGSSNDDEDASSSNSSSSNEKTALSLPPELCRVAATFGRNAEMSLSNSSWPPVVSAANAPIGLVKQLSQAWLAKMLTQHNVTEEEGLFLPDSNNDGTRDRKESKDSNISDESPLFRYLENSNLVAGGEVFASDCSTTTPLPPPAATSTFYSQKVCSSTINRSRSDVLTFNDDHNPFGYRGSDELNDMWADEMSFSCSEEDADDELKPEVPSYLSSCAKKPYCEGRKQQVERNEEGCGGRSSQSERSEASSSDLVPYALRLLITGRTEEQEQGKEKTPQPQQNGTNKEASPTSSDEHAKNKADDQGVLSSLQPLTTIGSRRLSHLGHTTPEGGGGGGGPAVHINQQQQRQQQKDNPPKPGAAAVEFGVGPEDEAGIVSAATAELARPPVRGTTAAAPPPAAAHRRRRCFAAGRPPLSPASASHHEGREQATFFRWSDEALPSRTTAAVSKSSNPHSPVARAAATAERPASAPAPAADCEEEEERWILHAAAAAANARPATADVAAEEERPSAVAARAYAGSPAAVVARASARSSYGRKQSNEQVTNLRSSFKMKKSMDAAIISSAESKKKKGPPASLLCPKPKFPPPRILVRGVSSESEELVDLGLGSPGGCYARRVSFSFDLDAPTTSPSGSEGPLGRRGRRRLSWATEEDQTSDFGGDFEAYDEYPTSSELLEEEDIPIDWFGSKLWAKLPGVQTILAVLLPLVLLAINAAYQLPGSTLQAGQVLRPGEGLASCAYLPSLRRCVPRFLVLWDGSYQPGAGLLLPGNDGDPAQQEGWSKNWHGGKNAMGGVWEHHRWTRSGGGKNDSAPPQLLAATEKRSCCHVSAADSGGCCWGGAEHGRCPFREKEQRVGTAAVEVASGQPSAQWWRWLLPRRRRRRRPPSSEHFLVLALYDVATPREARRRAPLWALRLPPIGGGGGGGGGISAASSVAEILAAGIERRGSPADAAGGGAGGGVAASLDPSTGALVVTRGAALVWASAGVVLDSKAYNAKKSSNKKRDSSDLAAAVTGRGWWWRKTAARAAAAAGWVGAGGGAAAVAGRGLAAAAGGLPGGAAMHLREDGQIALTVTDKELLVKLWSFKEWVKSGSSSGE